MSPGLLIAMALATYLTRLLPLVFLRGDASNPLLERWLRHVPVSIFAAIVAPGVFAPHGSVEWGGNAVAALVALMIAIRTRQLLLTVIAGMAVFWLLRALGG